MAGASSWVTPARHPSQDVGVFVFRCRFEVREGLGPIRLEVSADQRYQLWLDGDWLGEGPQRGDLAHWFYETYDLTGRLLPGTHELRAVVWNFGWLAPIAQMSLRTGFLCTSDLPELCTPGAWECADDPARGFAMDFAHPTPFYYAVGPSESLDARRLGEPEWRRPEAIVERRDAGSLYESFWALTPRTLPPMRREPHAGRPTRRRGFLGDRAPAGPDRQPLSPDLDLGEGPVVVDFGQLLVATPWVEVEGAPGTRVTLTYDEALWLEEEVTGAYGPQAAKGHRDEVAGKRPRGIRDHVILGAGVARFEPLWWRGFRYVTLEADGPATLRSMGAWEGGYPCEVESRFEADAPEVGPIFDTCVRTLARCAGEGTYDCPTYEQLQYGGDTRIQLLAHYYLSRDRRLARNAVAQLGWSQTPEGLTQSRYPNRTAQFIPPFSLWWVIMLFDQMLYDGDALPEGAAVGQAARAVEAFARWRQGQEAYWPFLDWVPGWQAGRPPGGARATAHWLTEQLARLAVACLEHRCAPEGLPPEITSEAMARLNEELVLDSGWVRARSDPGWQPTHHAEALARLVLRMLGAGEEPWPEGEAAGTTLYFSYYEHLARRPDDYLTCLDPWRAMLDLGLSTFAETPEPARSDCHAWSAHPALGFFQQVAGVRSLAPGWEVAEIEPKPGRLGRFEAEIAHPRGPLRVAWDGRPIGWSRR